MPDALNETVREPAANATTSVKCWNGSAQLEIAQTHSSRPKSNRRVAETAAEAVQRGLR